MCNYTITMQWPLKKLPEDHTWICFCSPTNKKLFLFNSQIHDINTRHNNNLHLPSTGLTLVQKGVAYSGCKIYNHLPPQIKNISNIVALFKSKLKKLLLLYIFYSVDEYYQKNYDDYDW